MRTRQGTGMIVLFFRSSARYSIISSLLAHVLDQSFLFTLHTYLVEVGSDCTTSRNFRVANTEEGITVQVNIHT